MKVAILTWASNTNNYGSILQAYALQNFLREYNYDNVILDYHPKISDYQWPPSIEMYRRRIFRRIKNLLKNSSVNDAGWKRQLNNCCEEFINRELTTSNKYIGVEQLKTTISEYDTFMCGSDQIWSMKKAINPTYYLTWLPKEKKKIAYAPSMPSALDDNRKRNAFIKNTTGFEAISVREEKSAKETSGILNKKIVSALDPTLLIGEEFWNKNTLVKDCDSKYILCYFLGQNKNYKKCVEQIKNETDYDVKVVPFNNESLCIDGEIQFGVDPGKFLELIRNAEIVLTDSYHGSIFSVIFEKKFILFKRFVDGAKDDENGRIYDLASKLRIEEQLCDANDFELESIMKPNYVEVKNTLNKLRDESKKYLLDALKRCE